MTTIPFFWKAEAFWEGLGGDLSFLPPQSTTKISTPHIKNKTKRLLHLQNSSIGVEGIEFPQPNKFALWKTLSPILLGVFKKCQTGQKHCFEENTLRIIDFTKRSVFAVGWLMHYSLHFDIKNKFEPVFYILLCLNLFHPTLPST